MVVRHRILGTLILLIATLGIGLSAVGIVLAHRIVGDFAQSLDSSLALSLRTLDTARDTLLLTRATTLQVNDGLATVEATIVDVAQVMSDTQPLLGAVVQVTSHDVPDSIEALQATLPDVAEAAALIDATLTTLNDLRLEPKVLGLPLRLEFDLGYEPEASFEESITSVGESLEGIAPRLRALEAHVEPMIDSLDTLKSDLEVASTDLKAVNGSIADVTLLIDEYTLTVTEAQDRLEISRARIPRQVYLAKLAMTLVLIWVGLAQMAPLHYGWKLLTGQLIHP